MSGTKKELSVQHTIMNCFELERYYNENIDDTELKEVLLNKLVSQMLYSFSNAEYQNIDKSYKSFLLRNSYNLKNKVKIISFILFKNYYYKIYKKYKI